MSFKQRLINLHACQDAIEWVGDRTMEEAWRDCERGDWMLWAHVRLFPDRKRERVLAAGRCANLVRHLMHDERSITAVDTAIAYGEGRATGEELRKAADAAWAACAAADAAWAAYAAADAARAAYAYAARAACAAADACAADADADACAAADAAWAAYAAADAARAADRAVTMADTIKKCADICRETIQIQKGGE